MSALGDRGGRRSGIVGTGIVVVTGLAAALVVAARKDETSSRHHTLPLIDRFADGTLEGRRDPAPPSPTVWRFEAEGTLQAFAAGPGVAELEVREGRLAGVATSPRPVVELIAPGPLGGGDTLHAIEVTLRASAGTELKLIPLGEGGPPAAAFASPAAPPGANAPLLPDDEVRTYSFPIAHTFAVGPFAREAIRRVVLLPTDQPGARFEIESLRLVFRREHLASIPSGIGWHGLSEVWREALVTRPGETARFAVQLPSRPWLDLAVGTLSELPVRFRVEIRDRSGREQTVLRRTVSVADRWVEDPVDLAAWAGDQVELLLAAESETGDALALWGSPVVRSRVNPPSRKAIEVPQGVVVVIADTLRRDHLETWGYDRATAPTLARLAREGVVFEDAIAQGVWTKVSVPSILTSLYPSTHGIVEIADRLPAGATTLAEIFREAGFATFMTSAIPFSGQLTNLHQGVEVMHESRSFVPPGKDFFMKSAREFFGRAEDWIEGHRDVPFFAVVHVADPHAPYRPFAPYDRLWTESGEDQWFSAAEQAVKPYLPPGPRRTFVAPTAAELDAAGVDRERFVRHELGWYDGSIRAMDAELGRLLDRLEHLGLADRVVIAFLSDHGEEFLEHGSHFHGLNVYGPNSNVPLLLWGPRYLPQGLRVEPTVQLVDVLPTLVELAGLEVPEPAQGGSLMPLVESASAGQLGETWSKRPAITERVLRRDEVTGDVRPGYAIVRGRWKLVEHVPAPAGRLPFELFDHGADPLDRHDLAQQHPEIVAALSSELARWREWASAQRLRGDDTGTVDAAELARLRSLGYLN